MSDYQNFGPPVFEGIEKHLATRTLTLRLVNLTLADLFALRMFTDDPLWLILQPIIKCMLGPATAPDYCDPEWRQMILLFTMGRDLFRKDIKTTQDFLLFGVKRLQDVTYLMAKRPEAFQWLLAEIMLLDLKHDRLAWMDMAAHHELGGTAYERIREIEGGTTTTEWIIAYWEESQPITFVFSQNRGSEERITLEEAITIEGRVGQVIPLLAEEA